MGKHVKHLVKHLTHKRVMSPHLRIATIVILVVCSFLVSAWFVFERQYQGKIYPSVTIDGIPFGGKTLEDAKMYWRTRNVPFEAAFFEFRYEDMTATISGFELELGYDATLSATQAFLIGRSGGILTQLRMKFLERSTDITPLFRFNTELVDELLRTLSEGIAIEPQDALFTFEQGKVTAFRPSASGRRVNIEETKRRFMDTVSSIPHERTHIYAINLPVEVIEPRIPTERANSYGIKERIGTGYSEFQGSIPGRIHNVVLAASKFNGVLIKPGETLSVNKTLGDVSAATGYQPAYIIKEGRTVLGDGGGVCQVSTTLFRAALDAGLPISERHAHAYRVHYYEEGGFKPGLDATVFDPTADLKIVNNTPGYILIQTSTDTKHLTLTFDFYGTGDGRKSEVFNHVVGVAIPPPPDRYEDDPTLKAGVIKQVDWAAWGAKTSFQYKVTRGSEVLTEKTFVSNYRPWQAVYLRGIQQ